MQKKTSIKTKENVFKGNIEKYIKTKQTKYKRGDVAIFAKSLLLQRSKNLISISDFEIANKVKENFGGATSVKSIQWYLCQMRKEGLIANYPPRKVRRCIIEVLYEIINMEDISEEIKVLSTRKLIVFAKKVSKEKGFKLLILSSIIEAINFLNSIGYIVIEQNNFKKEKE